MDDVAREVEGRERLHRRSLHRTPSGCARSRGESDFIEPPTDDAARLHERHRGLEGKECDHSPSAASIEAPIDDDISDAPIDDAPIDDSESIDELIELAVAASPPRNRAVT